MKFFTTTRLVCWGLLAALSIGFGISYITNPKTDRVLLYFEQAADNCVSTEERYLPRQSVYDFPVYVARELLLGPMNRRFLRLIDSDIRPASCFVKNNRLYIDLPVTVFSPSAKTSSLNRMYALLQKNILTNCPNIKSVSLYIGGILAFQSLSVPVTSS